MRMIFILLSLFIHSAFAGPLETKIEQYEELQGLLQRYCINNPNSANVKVLINGTELSCNHLLVLANRLKSQIDDDVEEIEEECRQDPRPETERLARQTAQVARESVCRPQSTDTQCLTSFACSMASKIGQSIPLFGRPISAMVRSCRGNYSAGGCIASIAKGIFDSLWGLISSVWDIGRAAVRGVGEWLGIIEAAENSTSERLMAAQRATRAYVSRFIRNPMQTLRESANAIFNGLKQAAMQSYGCEQWADARRPFVSRCLRPMTNWNCASCQQKFQVFCGIAGMAIGEIPAALLTGGAVGIASRIARAASAAIRANARSGRVNRGVAELLGRFRPPAGLTARVEQITARTARTMSALERRVIARWESLKNGPAAQAIARAARSVPAAEARRAMGFVLRPAAFYVDAIEAAARLGFRAGDEAVASVIGNSERAIVRGGVSADRIAGSMTGMERDLPAEAQAISDVTADDLRNLAGDTVDIPDEVVEVGRTEVVPTTEPSRTSGGIVVSSGRSTPSPASITQGGSIFQRAPAADIRIGRSPGNAVVSDITTGRITVTSTQGEDLLRRLGGEHVSFRDREIILDILMGGPRKSTYFDRSGRFDDAFRDRYSRLESRLTQNADELAEYRSQVEALSRERVATGNQRTLEELDDIRRDGLPVRDEAFDCNNLSRLTPGAFPAAGGNCRKLKFDEDVNGRYCSCGGMNKASFTWLVRCPSRAGDYSRLSTYVDELALPFDSAPEMCTRVDIPRGKECYIGPTSPTFAGFGGTTQILCEHRAPRPPRGSDGNPPTREQVAAYEAQLEDIRRFGIQFGEPQVRPVRWSPFSTFPEYQSIVERAARACTNVCDINELTNVQRQFENATAAIRARGNPAELQRLAVEQRNFDQYLRELREGRRTYPTSTDLAPDTAAPSPRPSPYSLENIQVNSNVPASTQVVVPAPQRVRAPDITLQVAGRLDDQGRIAAAERIIGNVSENGQRRDVLIRAHNVAAERGFNTYTPADLREKMNILRYNMTTDEIAAYRRANGNRYPAEVFTQREADEILRRGLAGNSVSMDADDAFIAARSASVEARTLQGRYREGGNLEAVRTTTRSAAQGYEVEAVRRNSPELTAEAWKLYARSGDVASANRMLQLGVRQGMDPNQVFTGLQRQLNELNAQIARNPANKAVLEIERDALRGILERGRETLGLPPRVAQNQTRLQTQTPPEAPAQPQSPARPQAIVVSEIPPRRAQEMANEFRLGTNGRTRDPQQAAELYYRASDGAIQRETRALRTTRETNYLRDRNFSEAFDQSLVSDGRLAIRMIDDIHEASGASGLNAFLAENFDRFNVRNPSPEVRRNLRFLMEHVREKYGNELYGPQTNYFRSWASANSDTVLANFTPRTRSHLAPHFGRQADEQYVKGLISRLENGENLDELVRGLDSPDGRAFRSGKQTTYFDDGVTLTPEEVVERFRRGDGVPSTTATADTQIGIYTVEHRGVKYEVQVCQTSPCVFGKGDRREEIALNEVRTVYPTCGPGVQQLVKLSDARTILQSVRPLTLESFIRQVPCP